MRLLFSGRKFALGLGSIGQKLADTTECASRCEGLHLEIGTALSHSMGSVREMAFELRKRWFGGALHMPGYPDGVV